MIGFNPGYGPQDAPSGGSASSEWTAGTVTAVGNDSLHINNGTLTAKWSAGQCAGFGLAGGVTLSAGGALQAMWNAGTVNVLGNGLAISSNTLVPQWEAGTVTSLSGGLSLTAGVLTDEWNVGTVSRLGNGLVLLSGTLTAPAPPWLNWAAGVPALSNFTEVNISSTVSVSQSSVEQIISILDTGANATSLHGLLYTAPGTTPYRIAMLICNNAGPNSNRALAWGFCDGTKYQVMMVANAYQATPNLASWSNSTTYVTQTVKTEIVALTGAGDIWLGCRNDGTNLYWEFSTDGVNFVTVASVAIASAYVSSAASIFIGIDTNSATNPSALSIMCFDPNGINRAFA